MQILTTRPQEEPTWGPDVYLVEHDNPRRNIDKDFDKAFETVKSAYPEEWQFFMVIEVLKKMGWRVMLTNPVHKEY